MAGGVLRWSSAASRPSPTSTPPSPRAPACAGPCSGRSSTSTSPAGRAASPTILEHLGPPTEKWWRDLRSVTLTPELVATLVAGVDDELAGVDSAELVTRRDAVLNALLAAKTGAGL